MRPAPIDFASYIGPGYFLRLSALGQAMRGLHGRTFLELGPGRGDVAAWLATRGGTGTLVDTSSSSIEFLRSRFGDSSGFTMSQDLSTIEVPENGFGLAVALEVLEHVPDDTGLLREMHGLLAPGGTAVISVPAFRRRWGKLDECVGHLRRYERDDILGVFSAAGFSDVRLYCYGFPVCAVFSLIRKVYYHRAFRRVSHESDSVRTGRSGVERPLEVRSRLLVRILYSLLVPMLLIQKMTLGAEFGEGWIAVAAKSLEVIPDA
jgi:SAM-dependent methyltransferase